MLAAALIAAAAGFGGCSDSSFSSTGPPSLKLQASPASLRIFTGQAGSVAIVVTRSAFSGNVALAVTGVPTGVSAILEPSVIDATSSTSMLVLVVASDATPGLYPLVVTGTGPGVTASATVALTVARLVIPGGSLSVMPAHLDIGQGASADAIVTVSRDANFAGLIDLVISGPATTILAVATPPRIVEPVERSRLQFTVAPNTPLGNYSFVVTGLSGSENRAAVLTVTVTAPQPVSITCVGDDIGYWTVPGDTWRWEVAIVRGAGFTGAVELSAEGLPEGVGMAMTPSRLESGVTRSAVDVTASATAQAGEYTFTFRGKASGMPDATAQCRLIVMPHS